MQITLDTNELIKTLQENKEKHLEKYNNAFAEYKEGFLEQLEALKAKVMAGDEFDHYSWHSKLTRPMSYRKEYDTAIEMLIAHEGSTINLDRKEFMAFHQDKWEWSDHFRGSISNPKGL